MGPSVPTCRRTRPSQEALFVFIMCNFLFIWFIWSFCFFGGIFCISVLSCCFSPLFLNIFLFLFLTVSHLLWWAELHSEVVLMIYKLHLNFSIWYKLRMERSCLTAAHPHVSAQILWSVLQHKAWWETITEACDARFIFSQQSFIDLNLAVISRKTKTRMYFGVGEFGGRSVLSGRLCVELRSVTLQW